MAQLAHELVDEAAARTPAALALRHGAERISYAALAGAASAVGAGLRACGAGTDERVALRLEVSPALVAALLGASAAGCAVVPIDPAWGDERCAAVLRDCGAGVLITEAAGLDSLHAVLGACPMLRTVVVHGGTAPANMPLRTLEWEDFLSVPRRAAGVPAAAALAALLYRVDAGGEARGMAMSHRNLVAGAQSTARCAGLGTGDRVLAALPLHSDYGLNALLATFAAGATAVLDEACTGRAGTGQACAALERLLGRGDLTGLFASPAALKTLAGLDLERAADLRYLVCAGGALERKALDTLRGALPRTRIHLLYDIGDACRSTSLMPSMLDQRPGSIGRALPYSEWRVLRPDGRECGAGETGELVRCGALVTLGYWNDPQRNTEHFRALPAMPAMAGLARREIGYYPGVAARKDPDGFLYLVETCNDIIVTQGYRVSPRDVEKIVVGTGLVAEAAAVGVAHPVLGQVIAVLATPRPGARLDSSILFGACRARLPQHMLPAMVDVRRAPLPRARDGQIDRALLAGELAPLFAEVTP
ncbi:MAG: acyl-CoA ligase (AMP-forming), exosortase system-associated [Massilia sp.]|nr:acyl-CoA ligase (AMP-forming), exosortase system-associated [Massilia sp.]